VAKFYVGLPVMNIGHYRGAIRRGVIVGPDIHPGWWLVRWLGWKVKLTGELVHDRRENLAPVHEDHMMPDPDILDHLVKEVFSD
jgi:hypothetical protein